MKTCDVKINDNKSSTAIYYRDKVIICRPSGKIRVLVSKTLPSPQLEKSSYAYGWWSRDCVPAQSRTATAVAGAAANHRRPRSRPAPAAGETSCIGQ